MTTVIGITLVVTEDNFFVTLCVVVLFHQIFEGMALGSRIAAARVPSPRPAGYELQDRRPVPDGNGKPDEPHNDASSTVPLDDYTSGLEAAQPRGASSPLSVARKLQLGAAFSLVTPVGMALGIALLNKFNPTDRATLATIGTLEALSAGILVWVGVVEMWAADWMPGMSSQCSVGGFQLALADGRTTAVALVSLIAGMAAMSFLGKWT